MKLYFITKGLKRINQATENSQTKTFIANLIKKISTVEEINSLINILQNLKLPPDPVFHKQRIEEWIKHIQDVVEAHHYATIELKKIIKTPKNGMLLALLSKIISSQNILLHENMLSLLRPLTEPQLPELINYITRLDNYPIPLQSSQGSFFSQKTFDQEHKDCLQLLQNVAQTKNKDTPFWDKANGLLQNALLIYPELHTDHVVNTNAITP